MSEELETAQVRQECQELRPYTSRTVCRCQETSVNYRGCRHTQHTYIPRTVMKLYYVVLSAKTVSPKRYIHVNNIMI